MKSKSLYLALSAAYLLMAGCATTMDEAPDRVAAVETKANTRISRITTTEMAQGTLISISGNGALGYKLFEKMDPPRLILDFGTATMDPTVQATLVDLGNVTGYTPVNSPSGEGGMLEIALKATVAHEIKERPDGMDILIGQVPSAPEKQAGQGSARIKDIKVVHGDDDTTVQLFTNGPLPKPQIFRLANPPRLVMDILGVPGQGLAKTLTPKTPELSAVQLVGTPDRIRLVLDLTNVEVNYLVEQDGDNPVIRLSHGKINGVKKASLGLGSAKEPILASDAPTMQDINFTVENHETVIQLRMNRSNVIAVTKVPDDSTIVMHLKGAKIPEHLLRHMDVSAYLGGAVASIDTANVVDGSKLTMHLAAPGTGHEIVKTNNEILLRITGKSAKEAATLNYKGEKITMDFKDIDIQNALKFLTEVSHLNIITSDSVKGNLTLRLEDIPWDQALDLILEIKGLGKSVEGNVLRIAPLGEMQTMASDRLKTQKSQLELETLVTDMIPISFADAAAIQKILEAGDEKLNTRLLSSRGTVTFDARSGQMIVQETPSNLIKIRNMIAKLDKPIPQILIEARIVQVKRDKAFDLGIRWGFLAKGGLNNWAAGPNMAQAGPGGSPADRADYGQMVTTPTNVNLMTGVAPNIGARLGLLSPQLDLDIELGAQETIGNSKLISSPRVMTLDNQAASIEQGQQIPYSTVSASGTQTSFAAASLSLKVTPKVSPNGYVTLDVDVHNDSAGVGSPPAIDTQAIKSKVLIKSGETVVLGGIYTKSSAAGMSGIPGLDKLPILGHLFKDDHDSEHKKELLIFITPKIINPPA